MDQNQISPAKAKQYVQEVFAKLGMPHEDTLIAAEYIIRADLVGRMVMEYSACLSMFSASYKEA